MNNNELSDFHLKRLHYGIQWVINNPEGTPFHDIAVTAFEEADQSFWEDVHSHLDLPAFVAVLIQNEEFVNIEKMIRSQYPMASIVGTLEEIHGIPLFEFEGKWHIYQT